MNIEQLKEKITNDMAENKYRIQAGTGISSGTFRNWKKRFCPSLQFLQKLADYFQEDIVICPTSLITPAGDGKVDVAALKFDFSETENKEYYKLPDKLTKTMPHFRDNEIFFDGVIIHEKD